MKAKIAVYSFVLSGRWIAWFLLCCVVAAVCLYLGSWQMSRADAMEARNTTITKNYDAAPLGAQEAMAQFQEFDPQMQWHPVEITGRYLPDQTRIVRNRAHDGMIGYEVLVPFRTTSGTLVVLDRGWISTSDAGDGSPGQVPSPPSGDVTVVARLQPSEADLQRKSPDGQIASIHLPGIAQSTGLDVETAAYGQVAYENPGTSTSPEALTRPELDYGPNLSYSLQWDAFAVLVFVAYGYSARQKVRQDQWEREYAAQVEEEFSRYYDAEGRFVPQGDGMSEEDVVRRLEMVGDIPAHLKTVMRPRRVKRSYAVLDAEEEDALLEAELNRK